MANKYDEKLGSCKFCREPLVRNPHTGKVFCSKKCWLRSAPPVESRQRPLNAPRSSYQAGYGESYQKAPQSVPAQNFVKLEVFNATFSKINENTIKLVRKIAVLERNQHALWATLIQGDKEKEKQYDFHSIPIAQPKPEDPEPEVPTWEGEIPL